MRLRIKLHNPVISGQEIPLNYQYPLSAAIYKIIAESDNEYAAWLHNKGFISASGNKRFKLFTFSMLKVPKREIKNGRLIALSPDLEFMVSMVSDKTIEHFISGIFKNAAVKIFDRYSNAEFTVSSVEVLPEPDFSEGTARFKTLSPIVLSKREDSKKEDPGTEGSAKPREKYLAPSDPEYFEYFKRNIEEKFIAYKLAIGEPLMKWGEPAGGAGEVPGVSGALEKGIDAEIQRAGRVNRTPKSANGGAVSISSLKILDEPRSKLITIKEGAVDETRVRGWSCSLELSGNPEVLSFLYTAGGGKMNSLGMGMVGDK